MPYTVRIPIFLGILALIGTSFIGNSMTDHDPVWLAMMTATH